MCVIERYSISHDCFIVLGLFIYSCTVHLFIFELSALMKDSDGSYKIGWWMLFIHTVFGAGRAFYSSVQIWILGIPDNAVQKPISHRKKKKRAVYSFCIFCFSLSLFSCPFLYAGPDFMSSTRESHNLYNTTYTALIAITFLSTSQETSVVTFQVIRVIISLWTPLNLSDYKSIVLCWEKSDCIAYLSALVLESEKPSYEC